MYKSQKNKYRVFFFFSANSNTFFGFQYLWPSLVSAIRTRLCYAILTVLDWIQSGRDHPAGDGRRWIIRNFGPVDALHLVVRACLSAVVECLLYFREGVFLVRPERADFRRLDDERDRRGGGGGRDRKKTQNPTGMGSGGGGGGGGWAKRFPVTETT